VPAAAVIPAPIAYIKVVAVKKLVVGSVSGRCRTTLARRRVVAAGRSRRAGPRVPSSRPPPGSRRPRLGVLVTGTSAGRIVGRRTRVSAPFGSARRARRAAFASPGAAAGSDERGRRRPPTPILSCGVLHRMPSAGRHVYFEQIRVLKAGSNLAGRPPGRVRQKALNTGRME
jgi:hypothetical protein